MTLVVSPLTRVRWVGGRIEVSAQSTVSTTDSDVLALMHAFATPRTTRSVQDAFPHLDVLPAVAELRAAGVLVPVGEVESLVWDGDSLAFHRRSRSAAVCHGGVPPVSPPVVPARSADVVPLERNKDPVLDSAAGAADLPTLLDARRSRRSWGRGPVRNLGRFLWLSAHNRFSDAHVVSRPYPSGGAAYSLELYVVVAPDAVVGVPAGIHRYCPDVHALDLVSREGYEPVLAAAGAAAGAESAPAAVIVTSRFERVASSYRELAYSLVLKEVGGLFQTMYLVAESLGLAVCALGGGCPDRPFGALIRADEQVEPVVGELLLGPR